MYFQALKGATPLKSAIDLFAATAPGPLSAIVAGIIMAKTGRYKILIISSWAVLVLGTGLIYLFDIDTPTWQRVLFQILAGLPVGALFTLTLPSIQASLSIEDLAHAKAAFSFARSFGSVWGIAMGTNVFIGTVNSKLRAIHGLEQLGLRGSTALGYATELYKLPESVRGATKAAYQQALKNSFLSFVPFAAFGLLIAFWVRELELSDFSRSTHGLERETKSVDVETLGTFHTTKLSLA